MKFKHALVALVTSVMMVFVLSLVQAEEVSEIKKIEPPNNEEYYLISTKEELNWLSENVNNGNKDLKNNGSAKLLSNIDYTVEGKATSFIPIGNKNNPYKGTFEGEGHVIKNVSINSEEYAGIFGYNEGTIRKLGLEYDIETVVATGSDGVKPGKAEPVYVVTGENFVGGICGCNSGTIESCYNGVVEKDDEGVSIKSVASAANVSGTQNVGGICGFSRGIVIKNCYNGAIVKGEDDVGGICGYNTEYSNITECYNAGEIKKIEGSEGIYIGGICGYQSESYPTKEGEQHIDYCSNSKQEESLVGNLVGNIDNSNIQGKTGYDDVWKKSPVDSDSNDFSPREEGFSATFDSNGGTFDGILKKKTVYFAELTSLEEKNLIPIPERKGYIFDGYKEKGTTKMITNLAQITKDKDSIPKREGYVFEGYIATSLARTTEISKEYIAVWEPKRNIPYKINIYKFNREEDIEDKDKAVEFEVKEYNNGVIGETIVLEAEKTKDKKNYKYDLQIDKSKYNLCLHVEDENGKTIEGSKDTIIEGLEDYNIYSVDENNTYDNNKIVVSKKLDDDKNVKEFEVLCVKKKKYLSLYSDGIVDYERTATGEAVEEESFATGGVDQVNLISGGDTTPESESIGSTIPFLYIEGDDITLPTAEEIKRDGYIFEGWYKDKNFTEKVEVINSGTFKSGEDKILYAKWLKKSQATVTGIADGAEYCSNFTIESDVTISNIEIIHVNNSKEVTLTNDRSYFVDSKIFTDDLCSLERGEYRIILHFKGEDKKGNYEPQEFNIKFVDHTDSGEKPTCITGSKCSKCGNGYGAVDPNNHTKIVKLEAKDPTSSKDGNIECYMCEGCNKYFSDENAKKELNSSDVIIKCSHEIIEGANSTWIKDSNETLEFKSDSAYDSTVVVSVDGEPVDSENYTVSNGTIELKSSYLQDLSEGEHSIDISSESGTASTNFKVASKASSSTSDSDDNAGLPIDSTLYASTDTTEPTTNGNDDINSSSEIGTYEPINDSNKVSNSSSASTGDDMFKVRLTLLGVISLAVLGIIIYRKKNNI